MKDSLETRLLRIKVLMLDLDGVLTDGRVYYGAKGDELKAFDIQDGFGLVLMRKAGLPVVIVTGKKSKLNLRRAQDLGITKIFQNVTDKLKVFDDYLSKSEYTPEEICYIGDDLMDYPVMKRVGVSVAVPNAVAEIRKVADWVTERSGGRGAVREVVDRILKIQKRWDGVLAPIGLAGSA